MTKTATLRLDKTWLSGLFLLVLSLFIFCIPQFFHLAEMPDGLFFVNYILAVIYFGIICVSGRLSIHRENGLAPLFVLLVLCLVSCYALNRTMGVFENSVPWWSTLLIITSINYLATPFYSYCPRWLQDLSCVIAGIALIAFLYLAIYLLPIYVIGIFGIIALGMGLHVFVPLLFVGYTIVFIRQTAGINRRSLYAFGIGICIAIGTIVQFTVRWSVEVRRINLDLFQSPSHDGPPAWAAVAQHCQPSTFNEHFLKAGLVYETPPKWNWDIFSIDPKLKYHEQHRHDPLIMIASALAGESNLDNDSRVKILESLYDSRHYALQRLWSDDALATTGVKTNVELYPNLHLSYTEEELTVAAVKSHDFWPVPQEAIYTFHLPEGAAVSALSLWINNREEKGVFTSRHKADSAYQQIVGYEHRDPSVVHWQEGNKVVVRVFPIDPYSARRFKIGITAPLESKDNRLFYHSIYFDGPPANQALGSVNIHPLQPLNGLQQSRTKEENYEADWSLSFQDPGIASQTFTFNGNQYTTEAATPAFDTLEIIKVYLDLNKSWTHDEFSTLLPLLKDKKIYVWQPSEGLVKLTPDNQEALYSQAKNWQFSLFPLPVISDKAHALLISKSSASSPALSDLNQSDYVSQLQTYLASPGKLRLFSVGDELSPYLSTLKACGAFHFEKGDWPTLYSHLIEHRFLHDSEAPDLVNIDPAGLLIRRTSALSPAGNGTNPSAANAGPDSTARTSATGAIPDSTSKTSAKSLSPSGEAPDHLLRLFAYRQIQQQLNGQLPGDFTSEDPATVDSLVQTAQEGGIVSPVSSLVVLETAEDYKKFDITQSQNGLKNASLHAKGAVPEPGEWALLLTALGVLFFLRLRRARGKNIGNA